MTANELRIGNYVEYFQPHDEKWQLEKVDLVENSINEIQNNEEFRPIPLTEELFNSLGLDPNFWKRLGEKTIGYRDNNPSDFIAFPCEYLHQLQNIYYCLFGTELPYNPTINRPKQ